MQPTLPFRINDADNHFVEPIDVYERYIEPRWREKTYSGTLIRVGRHLVVLGDASGVLRVAEAVPTSYKEVARANAFNAGSQSVVAPSYADGRIFVRNLEEMVAFAVGGAAGRAGVNP